MVKNGCRQPGTWTLKLTVSPELTDFLHAGTTSHHTNQKMIEKFPGEHGQK